jgi:hypothetical protein
MTYPARDKYYAHKLTRLLFKSCAAQSIGQDAVLLIIHIAHTEDAARYQGPVRFWNSQLNEVLGFRSPKSLNNARSKAVNAGWLVYSRKNDRADGLYFTTIPKNVIAFDDEPIEPVPVSVPSTESIPLSVPSTEQKAEQESYALRNRKVTGNDPLPNPVPIPNPNKKRPCFVAPSIEEVRTYCQQRKNSVDPEQFVNHYQANGWVQGKGKPIRDWRAAVITWEKNSLSNRAKPSPSIPQKKPYALPARETA